MGERTGFAGLKRVTAVERLEVAKITAYDFGLKKNGLALVKSTEEKPSHLLIRRRAGWLLEDFNKLGSLVL